MDPFNFQNIGLLIALALRSLMGQNDPCFISCRILGLYAYLSSFGNADWERSGSVVECLT